MSFNVNKYACPGTANLTLHRLKIKGSTLMDLSGYGYGKGCQATARISWCEVMGTGNGNFISVRAGSLTVERTRFHVRVPTLIFCATRGTILVTSSTFEGGSGGNAPLDVNGKGVTLVVANTTFRRNRGTYGGRQESRALAFAASRTAPSSPIKAKKPGPSLCQTTAA